MALDVPTDVPEFFKNYMQFGTVKTFESLMVNFSQKMKFSIKDCFSFLQICSHLIKKSLIENFSFCTSFFTKNEILH